MTPRHAAALALVGWYLMTPPTDYVTHLPNGSPNLDAPFSYWRNEGSFDSAKECKVGLENNIEFAKQIEKKVRKEESEQQESAEEEKMDQQGNVPKGFYRGLRGYALTAAVSAQCIATDDPRLKEK